MAVSWPSPALSQRFHQVLYCQDETSPVMSLPTSWPPKAAMMPIACASRIWPWSQFVVTTSVANTSLSMLR